MSLTASIRRAAVVNPRGLAIVSGTQRRSWPEFAQRVASIAGALRRRGLEPGAHVAILALNSPAHLEVLMAVWWAGGVIVPINTRLSWEEIRYILEHSQARLLVTDESFQETGERARESMASLVAVVCLDAYCLEELVAAPPIAAAEPPLDVMAGLFYTGGTTGSPKGVMLTHQNFLVAALNMERDLRTEQGSVYLNSAPLFHLAGFGTAMSTLLAAGGHSFIDKFSADVFYERLAGDAVTHVMLVPSMISLVLDSPLRDDRLLAQVKSLSYGAAPIGPALLQRVLDAFPNARLTQFYGMTEVCGASTRLAPERHVLEGPLLGKLGSVGQPLECFEMRIVRPDGTECARGEPGEILMRGPAVTAGYWKAPDQTAATLIGGWLHSGDVGRMDEDGYVFLVDRLKDMIISGGENIYSVEVENAIEQHPGVASCAVIGVPDDKWGERVHAVVVLKPDASVDADTLVAHCKRLIAGYKCPRSLEFRESLPLSGISKVLKSELRKPYWQGRDRQLS